MHWLLLLMMMMWRVVTRLLLLVLVSPLVGRRGSVVVAVAPLSPPLVPVPGLQLVAGQRGARGWRGPPLVHAGAAAPSNH